MKQPVWIYPDAETKVMKSIVFVILTSVLFVACEQQETLITPTFKESVQFMVDEPELVIEEAIPAENIQRVAEEVSEEFDGVQLNDVWLEVTSLTGNSASLAKVNMSVMGDNDNVELINGVVINIEKEKTIVPLISILSAEGYSELLAQLNAIAEGSDTENIRFSLKGDSFFKDGLNGNVNIEVKMFIRYSF
jgi:hypothetical protein